MHARTKQNRSLAYGVSAGYLSLDRLADRGHAVLHLTGVPLLCSAEQEGVHSRRQPALDDDQAVQIHKAMAVHGHQARMQYRMSPFVNSRASGSSSTDAATEEDKTTMRRWFAVADPSLALHGFLIFEVSWRDVHGINYLNELLTDTSLALEARYMKKWEFYSADQAAGCTAQWFLGRASEAQALRGYLSTLHHYQAAASSSVGEEDQDTSSTMPPPMPLLEDKSSGTTTDEKLQSSYSPTTLRRRRSWRRRKLVDDPEEPTMEPAQYNDTLILFRFRDGSLPFKLRQIIMSDIRLLTLLESGLPPWVIFFQSYPVLCHLYRPWMRPLARSLYVVASLVTVIIGFYDLYKNVPLLKSAAARICGPLFGWIETWDMVTRIQYLGTILFLRNLRKCLQGLVTVLRAARALLRAVVAPLGICEVLAFSYVWEMVVDLAEVVWAPFDVVLDCVAGVVASMWPALWVVLLPVRCAVAVAGSVLSNSYNLFKDMWETMSSIFELNHMSEAQQSAFDMTLLKALWNDLFSQIFRAIRGILNGILVFFASCNRHRLSIYNHTQSRLRHMLRVARLAAPHPRCSCQCKSMKRRSGRNNEDDAAVEECDVCK